MSVDPESTGAPSGEHGGADGRQELSEADSRVLDALTRADPPVVTAVEDDPETARAVQDERVAPLSAPGGRSPLAPVFQEPQG